METLLGLLVGVGLSAACGFRVFVPLLVVALACRTGHLDLATGFEWMGSNVALMAFGVATVLEVVAYYVPWLDNVLDALATPAAVAAGTVITASLVAEVDPFLRWTLALIAGGGVAGLIQGSTVYARGLSTTATGGVANPVVATAELGGSLLTALLATLLPVVTACLVLAGLAVLGWWLWRRRRLDSPTSP